MNTKEKIAGIIIGAGAGIIFAITRFLIYINNDTVKAGRQPELSQQYLPEEDYEQETEAANSIKKEHMK